MEKYMRSIIMGSVLFIAASLLIGCKTMGLKSSDRGGYAAYENDQKIKKELSDEIRDLELRLKKLEDDKNN